MMCKNGKNLGVTISQDITEISNDYKELVETSSLRFLKTCCEIFELDDSNLELDTF
jgi:hypothetical protein